MGYYVIHGDCKGSHYYLKDTSSRSDPNAFKWQGLKNNASKFLDRDRAEELIKKLHSFSKIKMKVVQY
jgi:hypothetical protein